MNHSTSAVLAILSSFLLFSPSATSDPCAATNSGGSDDLSVFPTYGKCSPFTPPGSRPNSGWTDIVLEMASTDPARLAYLSSLVASRRPTKVPVASGHHFNIGNYVVRVKLGTPGQSMFMVLDTSSDTAFVPSAGCSGCPSSVVFSPAASSTHAALECAAALCSAVHGISCPSNGISAASAPCSFNQSYGSDSSFAATLSHDSLWLAGDVIPGYAFGLVRAVSGKSLPPQGLLGLGRGPLSLLSQSGSLYSGVFSYCLPSFKSYYFSGSLKLGPLGQPKRLRTTPLLRNPHRPSLYYANLTGISVGKVMVRVDPKHLAFDPYSGAGTVIDSGTVITRFVEPVYAAIREEFRKQVSGPFSSLGAFDTCFAATSEAMAPPVTFHFEGLDLLLPMENSLIHSSVGSLACLSMAAAPNNVNSVLNVIANLQQQNLRILFDVANSRLGISRELCN